MVVFGGTALVPNIHFSLGELVKKAKQVNRITVVNTVFDFLSEKNDPSKPWLLGDTAETYKYIDLLITDMEEALRLSGTQSVEAAIQFFKTSGVGSLIITHGSNDLHFFADNDLFGQVPYSRLPVSEKVKTELKEAAGREGDTTGCGDNFTGGVIASITAQLIVRPGSRVNFLHAIALGVASGGFSCFYYGGTYYEQHPGEKKERVDSYYCSYLLQNGLTVNDR
jgi:sugar/nucleoside kinase (ribokinase family)